jgi:hypothetical protein
MFGSGLEYLKTVFQTLLKVILVLRIYQIRQNYEQTTESHLLKTENSAWSHEFACKELFRGGLQLG